MRAPSREEGVQVRDALPEEEGGLPSLEGPVVVTGGSGLIGQNLSRALRARGSRVVILTRGQERSESAGVEFVHWDARSLGRWATRLDGASAVVHLSGASIGARRWTPAVKAEILQSRIASTRAVVSAMAKLARPPAVLLSASAVGYYGDRGEDLLTEADPPGEDFLAQVVLAWEREALAASALGVRVVCLRFGLVLHRGGALERLILPYRWFLGGRLGDGAQWHAWVALTDALRAILFLLARPDVEGPVNVTSPQPVKNRELAATLAELLHRPAWLPLPRPLLRLALGEMAEALLLSSQRVVPERLQSLGFPFLLPDLRTALQTILSGEAALLP